MIDAYKLVEILAMAEQIAEKDGYEMFPTSGFNSIERMYIQQALDKEVA